MMCTSIKVCPYAAATRRGRETWNGTGPGGGWAARPERRPPPRPAPRWAPRRTPRRPGRRAPAPAPARAPGAGPPPTPPRSRRRWPGVFVCAIGFGVTSPTCAMLCTHMKVWTSTGFETFHHKKRTQLTGQNVELFSNYATKNTHLWGAVRRDGVHISRVGSGIMVELCWNYAPKKHYKEEKHEKKGAIIPPPRLAGSQTGSGIMTPKNGWKVNIWPTWKCERCAPSKIRTRFHVHL